METPSIVLLAPRSCCLQWHWGDRNHGWGGRAHGQYPAGGLLLAPISCHVVATSLKDEMIKEKNTSQVMREKNSPQEESSFGTRFRFHKEKGDRIDMCRI
jgi:hypothetical protein